MKNLYEETISKLEAIEKTEEDIDFIEAFYYNSRTDEYIKITSLEKMKPITYYSGYGGQEIDGYIVFKDGSWLERGEYDGAEWWDYKTTPKKGDLERGES